MADDVFHFQHHRNGNAPSISDFDPNLHPFGLYYYVDNSADDLQVVDTHETPRFNWFTALTLIFSVGFFISDIGTDIALAITYYRNGYLLYFILTVTFVLLPALILNLVSYFRTECMRSEIDIPEMSWRMRMLKILCHSLLIGFIFKIYESFWCKRKYKNIHLIDLYLADAYFSYAVALDGSLKLLFMLRTFLESIPQLFFQYYIYRVHEIGVESSLTSNDLDVLKRRQLLTLSTSVLAISWSVVLYSQKSPPEGKRDSFWFLFNFTFNIYTNLTRLFILILFFVNYTWWSLVSLVFKLFVMSLWLIYSDISMSKNLYPVGLLELLFGLIYFFTFVNLKTLRETEKENLENVFWRKVFYYVYDVIETTILIVLCRNSIHEYVFEFSFVSVYLVVLWVYFCYLLTSNLKTVKKFIKTSFSGFIEMVTKTHSKTVNLKKPKTKSSVVLKSFNKH